MTFHAACGRILRREAQRLGYRSNFTIYDTADQIRLVKQCLEELERDPKRFTPRGIHSQISNAKNQLDRPGASTRRASRASTTRRSPTCTSCTSAGSSPRTPSTSTTCSILTVDVLERFPEAREKWQKAFRYVLVDEYQDTNHAQYRFLQLLAAQHNNVFAVGDPDQSIYAFRGADIRNILEFERDFPGAKIDRARAELPLDEHDPRGRERASSRNNRERKPKNLWSELGDGEPVRVDRGRGRARRGALRRRRDRALVEEGYSGSEIAVFYRTNAQSRVLEDVLVRQGVAYQVIGGPRFYERAEVKDLDRVPAGDRQPVRRRLAAARSRTARAAASATRRSRS